MFTTALSTANAVALTLMNITVILVVVTFTVMHWTTVVITTNSCNNQNFMMLAFPVTVLAHQDKLQIINKTHA